jgi:putative protease
MVNTTGQLYEAKKRGLTPICSHRLNAFNSATPKVMENMGALWTVLSPELTIPQIRDISAVEKTAIVYGRLPLMTLYRCAISDGGKNCKAGGDGICRGEGTSFCHSEIVDRKGVSFPIISLPDCTNIVYNSVPIYMADKKKDLDTMGITRYHFIFSTETKEECRDIIKRYKEGLAAPQNMKFTRIQ